ncbi:unnamed protein product, partial [Ranitomeya imitator]
PLPSASRTVTAGRKVKAEHSSCAFTFTLRPAVTECGNQTARDLMDTRIYPMFTLVTQRPRHRWSLESCLCDSSPATTQRFTYDHGQVISLVVIVGGVLIPAAAIGQIIGGLIVSKFKFDCKMIIRFCIILSIISVALTTVFIFAKCGNDPFAGVSVGYNGTVNTGKLGAPCNSNCSCARSFYDPVCGADGVQYFSACYAGCTSQAASDDATKIFTNCECIGSPVREIAQRTLSLNVTDALPGKCETSCTNLILFMVFFFFVVVTTFMIATPITIAILRCVPDKQRSFALGVQWSFIRLLGSIPGPIVFGVVIDSSCILWNLNECGSQGACWTYNNSSISYKLIGISAASKALTIIFLIVAYFIYKPPASKPDPSQDNGKVISSEAL